MKKFSAFLIEAEKSQAAKAAKTLKLKHIGYGRYADASGNVTHMSKDGKLVKVDPKNPDITPTQQNGEEETGDGSGKVDQGSVSITFGRFNPPTVGHEKLLDKVAKEAKTSGGEYRIYPSRSEDPKKNPLDAGTKVKYMRMAYPDHANSIVDNPDMRTIFDVLAALDSDGYSSVNIVVGGDRVSEFNSLAQKYNGDLYTFDEIKVVSAGDRDPDAEGVEGMSASKMRAFAASGDLESFTEGVPGGNAAIAKRLMNEVRKGMGISEEEQVAAEMWEIAPKLAQQDLREAYFQKDVFEVGQLVEHMDTGVRGTVTVRGANYVIYETAEGYVFKSWLQHIAEVTEKEKHHSADDGSGNDWKVGTDTYRKAVQEMTPGQSVKKFSDFRKSK